MKTAYYHGFQIRYQPKQTEEVHQFLRIIKNHPSVCNQIFPKKISLIEEEKGFVYIKNLEEMIRNSLYLFYIQEEWKIIKGDKEKLRDIYLMLFKEKRKKENCLEIESEGLDYDAISAALYFDEFEGFLEYMKTKYEKKGEIQNFLKSNCQMEIFNYLLEKAKTNLEILDIFRIEEIQNFAKELFQEYLLELEKEEFEETYQFSRMEYLRLDLLIKEFLLWIDPSGDWINIYLKAKNEKRIDYKKSKEKERENKSFSRANRILLKYHENTYDFFLFSKILIEYIEKFHQREEKATTLEKIPLIYYEEKALAFLRKKGFSEEEIKQIEKIRKKEFLIQYLKLGDLLEYLVYYQKRGKLNIEDFQKIMSISNFSESLTKEEVHEMIKEKITNSHVRNLSQFGEVWNLPREEKERIEIDKYMDIIINTPNLLRIDYSYLIGMYIKKIRDEAKEDIAEKMKYFTEHLDSQGLEYVVKTLKKA